MFSDSAGPADIPGQKPYGHQRNQNHTNQPKYYIYGGKKTKKQQHYFALKSWGELLSCGQNEFFTPDIEHFCEYEKFLLKNKL